MSCCGSPCAVNPERLGESGRWVMAARPAPRSTACVHTWQHRNALGIVGGPVIKVCTGCGEAHYPQWVPDVAARLALPAAPFVAGESEWADVLRERGAA